MSKKGMSTLIASLILVTLCLVALVFVGITIKNSFEEDSNKLDVEQFTLDLEISKVQVLNETDVEVTVKRNSEDKDLSGVEFVLYDEDNLEVGKKSFSIKELEESNFSIILKVLNSTLIEKISIAPIFKKRFGKDTLGGIQDEKPIRSRGGGSSGGGESSGTSSNSGDSSGEEDTNRLNNEDIVKREIFFEGMTVKILDGEKIFKDSPETNPLENAYVESECGVCDIGFSCVESHCTYDGPGEVYYLAVDGNDSNPGTISKPWATFQHAITQAEPGDTVYIRGGVYYEGRININPPSKNGNSGEKNAWIRYLNYPGERPIFDSSNNEYEGYFNMGLGMHGAEYIHLRGFTVRNVFQKPYNTTENRSAEAGGIGCTSCGSMIYENLVVHDVNGRGFQHWTGAWNDFDAEYAYERCLVRAGDDVTERNKCKWETPFFEEDKTFFINCDSYNLYDLHYYESPGNAADGYKGSSYYGTEMTFIGSRAWNYSDDGFDPFGMGKRIFDTCWAMPGDSYEGLSENWDPESNGFKTTPVFYIDTVEEDHRIIFRNSISAFGEGSGFITNLAMKRNTLNYPSNALIYNNLAYKMGTGYTDHWYNHEQQKWLAENGDSRHRTNIYRNNIAFRSTRFDQIRDPTFEIFAIYPSEYDESHNTWVKDPEWPGWEYNPEYNVTEEDFESLFYEELTSPRRSDFTLPDISFGHLRDGSELIDAGIVIEGFHCSSAGPHPGEDCKEWYGDAPDIGPFEKGSPEREGCRGPTVRQCISGDGIGEQKRSCTGPGEWSNFGLCEFVSCETGYELVNGECVIAPGWSRELVLNPSFEGRMDYWVASDSHWSPFKYKSWGAVQEPYDGLYTAYVSSDARPDDYLYQDVDLIEYVSLIDAGLLEANISGWAISSNVFNAMLRIQFMFLDENKNVLATPYDSEYQKIREWWEASVSDVSVPVGTRYIRVWGNSYDDYNQGLSAGCLDLFSVKVHVLS